MKRAEKAAGKGKITVPKKVCILSLLSFRLPAASANLSQFRKIRKTESQGENESVSKVAKTEKGVCSLIEAAFE